MLDGGVEGVAEVVRVDDLGQEPEGGRQSHGLVPTQDLALLDVQPRLRELADGAHVVEMRVALHDVGDVVGSDAHLGQHAKRGDPVRHVELDRDRLAAALAHEARVAQDDPAGLSREHEGERQVVHLVDAG